MDKCKGVADKSTDGSDTGEKLHNLLEQLSTSQQRQFDELRQQIQELNLEINQLRYSIESRFQETNKDIQYVLLRLSVKERVKVRFFKFIRWVHGVTSFNKQITTSSDAPPFPDEKQDPTGGCAKPSVEIGQESPDTTHETIIKKMKEIEAYPLEVTVVPNWECNYHCTYCFATKPKDKTEYRTHTGAEWEKALYSIYQKYGKCQVTLSGGEPLIYKDGVDLVINLTKYHHVFLGTNLSIDEETLAKILLEASGENLHISPSLHLEHTSIELFIKKCLLIRKHEVGLGPSVVCYPKYLSEMINIKKKFEENGLWIGFFPYLGNYGGKTYPDEYSKEELDILWKLPGWHDGMRNQTKAEKITLPKVKGVLCYTGVKFIFVYPDGDVIRCIPVRQFGNIFDAELSLPQKPTECPVDVCNCSVYWKYLVK